MRWRTVWIALVLAGCGGGHAALPKPPPATAAAPAPPNVVFVLADDLAWNLVTPRFMPHVTALERRGETFDHYFVADSLCCPSRATIFTGDFPHDTGVLANVGRYGGYRRFQQRRLDGRTFAVPLAARGYATSMLGKYLNGYGDPAGAAAMPPGWSDWHVSNGTGYREFDYVLDDNGRWESYGGPVGGCVAGGPRADMTAAAQESDDYGVDVLSRDATGFIRRSAGRQFLMEAATFAPHRPYTPSPRNACDFPGLGAPRDPSFDAANEHAPAWLARRPPLSAGRIARLDRGFRRRAQSVEAVDALVARIESQLRAEHELSRTYIVFSSDNGYHMGQHRMLAGKRTAFDSDIRVPLIVAGPGVPRGRLVHQVAQNTDLAPTFVQLAGGTDAGIDGHSLVPLLRRHPPARWRTLALVEHRGGLHRSDPDYESGRPSGDPPSYDALRISARRLPHFRGPVEAVYVSYRNGAREFYDIARDPLERRNEASALTRPQRRELHRLLAGLVHCHDARACWRAARPAQSLHGRSGRREADRAVSA
jgi:N-acetylglucosamine-6-sulfatase